MNTVAVPFAPCPPSPMIPRRFLPRFGGEPSLLVLTHGTRFFPDRSDYFVGDSLVPGDNSFLGDLAVYFGCKEAMPVFWPGGNNHEARRRGSDAIFYDTLAFIHDMAKQHQVLPETIPVVLAGHSHGGNVMILAANLLKKAGMKVALVFTLSTACRPEYRLQESIPHLQLYSMLDWLLLASGWDFDFGICDLDFRGPGRRKFPNAVNICYDTWVGEEEDEAFRKMREDNFWNVAMRHQITRWSRFVIKSLEISCVRENVDG